MQISDYLPSASAHFCVRKNPLLRNLFIVMMKYLRQTVRRRGVYELEYISDSSHQRHERDKMPVRTLAQECRVSDAVSGVLGVSARDDT